MSNSFGLAPIAKEGSPVHPINCGLDNPYYNKQLIRYMEYWKEQGMDITQEIDYETYKEIVNE